MVDFVFYLIFILIFIGSGFLIIKVIKIQAAQKRELFEYKQKVKQDYNSALERIVTNTNDGDARIDALNKGRLYYSSLRADGALSATEEVAIANDIAAYSGKNT